MARAHKHTVYIMCLNKKRCVHELTSFEIIHPDELILFYDEGSIVIRSNQH